MTPSDRTPEDGTPGKARSYGAVDGLAEQARQLADRMPNRLADLTQEIRSLIDGDVDPYMLMGVLLEGLVQTVSTRIPVARQEDTMLATLIMLRQRLDAVIDVPSRRSRCDSAPESKR